VATEARAYHYPESYDPYGQYYESGESVHPPVPSERRIMPSDIPDPLAAKPIVLGLYHPSGAILYSGAATAEEAASAMVALFRGIKPELPQIQLISTTTTVTPQG
jgi:hypothetical protein